MNAHTRNFPLMRVIIFFSRSTYFHTPARIYMCFPLPLHFDVVFSLKTLKRKNYMKVLLSLLSGEFSLNQDPTSSDLSLRLQTHTWLLSTCRAASVCDPMPENRSSCRILKCRAKNQQNSLVWFLSSCLSYFFRRRRRLVITCQVKMWNEWELKKYWKLTGIM